jgi:hypothetical protein
MPVLSPPGRHRILRVQGSFHAKGGAPLLLRVALHTKGAPSANPRWHLGIPNGVSTRAGLLNGTSFSHLQPSRPGLRLKLATVIEGCLMHSTRTRSSNVPVTTLT